MLYLNRHQVVALVNSTSTHTIISKKLETMFNLYIFDYILNVSTSRDKTSMLQGHRISDTYKNKNFDVVFILLDLEYFGIIMGIDCLYQQHAFSITSKTKLSCPNPIVSFL